ncbi:WxL domain-containing protein [Gottfriedia acidiceleris]|uniref:WxL domain-containing protein n=1 Tax=Gottfriedia acidiceleris TaxID=371036 RepID=UPI000B43D631|nr:WxL domain-containing protein [Gottfriedia acidiceleris]
MGEKKIFNFKKIVAGGVATTATVVLFATNNAFAAINPTDILSSPDGKGATTYGHVNIVPGDGTTGPVDPVLPSEPNGETGNTGALTIDYVTPLEFGSHQVQGSTIIVNATSKNPNVQVTDVRATGAGWTLQVTASPFVEQNDSSKKLVGATLSFPAGETLSTAGNISEAPTMRAITLNTEQSSSDILMSAQANQGMGTWVDKLDPTQIKLSIPSGNFEGDYVSTLNWTLLDAPQ